MTCEIHVSDIGTEFILTIKDCDENIIDISNATSMNIFFKKPNGDTITRVGAFYTDGTDGKMSYTIIDGDIDEVGSWKIQAQVVAVNGTWKSSFKAFKVHRNL